MLEINTKTELDNLLGGDTPVLLDFYAEWCGPCRALLPTVESLSEKYKKNFVMAKINIDKHSQMAEEYNVRNIPALFFIKDRVFQEKLVGLHATSEIEKRIRKYANITA